MKEVVKVLYKDRVIPGILETYLGIPCPVIQKSMTDVRNPSGSKAGGVGHSQR